MSLGTKPTYLFLRSSHVLANLHSRFRKNARLPLALPPITYYWTVSLIVDHSYLVGNLTSSKIADTKVPGF